MGAGEQVALIPGNDAKKAGDLQGSKFSFIFSSQRPFHSSTVTSCKDRLKISPPPFVCARIPVALLVIPIKMAAE